MGFEAQNASNGNITGNTVTAVQTHYGPRKTDKSFGMEHMGRGEVRMLSYVLDLDDVISGAPATSNVLISAATHNMNASIPAYAKVLSARVEVIEAISTTGGSAASSASITVGLEQADGTDIDLDGLLDATDGALTIASNDIAQPRGSYRQGGSAALVPDYGTAATPGETVSIGANAGELYALLAIDDVTGMTDIAGKIRILVEYLPEGV